MKITQVRKMSPLDRFCYWIEERETIRLRKEAGEPKPWTDDKILQSFRFCNVRRMDDKVSRWLLENWYKPYRDHPNMLAAVALARFLNLPSSLEAIGFPDKWNTARIKRTLRKIKANGRTIFNAAYMVRGNDGTDKVESVVTYNVLPLLRTPPRIVTSSMEKTHATLLQRYGLGSFMAGQIVADLRHALTGRWKDKHTWAPIGPGSQRGMNRLIEYDLNRRMDQSEFSERLSALITVGRNRLPQAITRRMEAMDWQNCLCEFDTYERVLLGQGRKKQRYNGCP